jgi:hypothetical protein
MDLLAMHGFGIAFWALVFWGSLRIIDRGNVKNTFTLAVCLGLLDDFTNFFGIPDVLYVGAWLVFLVRLVTWHYDVGLLRAILVTATTVLAPYFLMPQLVKFVGDSEARAYVVLYGLPIGVFGTWIVTALRKRGRTDEPVHGDDSAVPPARIARWSRKSSAKPPVVAAPRVVAPPIAAPVVASKLVEPITPPSDGGPTFLR